MITTPVNDPIDICYFCGEGNANTKEDIPPRSLFPKGHGCELIKVPAHLKCNQEWGDSIEYVRNLLSGLSPFNPTARNLFEKRVRSLDRKPPLRLKMVNELRRKIDIYSQGGIYLGSQPGVQINSNLMNQFVSHMVKGLYYHHKNNILPKGATINWRIQPRDEAPDWISRLPIIMVHPEVFRYRYSILDDHPEWSTWILGFYDLSIGTIMAISGRNHNP
ncbi:MAG: hypothetical protein ISS45_05785 [Candidatus Omnitrophica bacterium]|nr:hypothetical protein [Candidatus Omnitrophota bacterium]